MYVLTFASEDFFYHEVEVSRIEGEEKARDKKAREAEDDAGEAAVVAIPSVVKELSASITIFMSGQDLGHVT